MQLSVLAFVDKLFFLLNIQAMEFPAFFPKVKCLPLHSVKFAIVPENICHWGFEISADILI